MKITVHNPGTTPMPVGAAYVMPGESRTFDQQDVPRHLWPDSETAAPASAPATDAIADLQKKTVKEILAAIPDLSADDLKRLGDLEVAAKKPRTSLIDAISALELERANAQS